MLNFKNCQLTISGSTILCDSASISESNPVNPVYAMGYGKPIANTPIGSLNNTINFSYFLETNNDPNFYLANNIKSYNFDAFPVSIVVAGRTGQGYLDSYSIDIQPNNLVKATSTYKIFTNLNGTLSNQIIGLLNYNTLNNSGLAHYFTVYPKLSNSTTTGTLLQMKYDIKFNWKPIYKIGQSIPVQVKFLGAEENFSIVSEYNNVKITFSGEEFTTIFNDIELIEINNISSDWTTENKNSLYLYPASGKIISNNVNFSEQGPILQETNIKKFY